MTSKSETWWITIQTIETKSFLIYGSQCEALNNKKSKIKKIYVYAFIPTPKYKPASSGNCWNKTVKNILQTILNFTKMFLEKSKNK